MAKKTKSLRPRMTPGEALAAAQAMTKGAGFPKPLTGAKPERKPGELAKANPPATPLTKEDAARKRKAEQLTAASLPYARSIHDIAQRGFGKDDPRADVVMYEGGVYTNDVVKAALASAGSDPLKRDPIEELMVVQILTAHARSLRYADLAAMQNDVVNTKCIAQAADGAGNLFRRLVQTLIDYRNPNRGATVMAKQANVAAQQTVNQAQQQLISNSQNEKPSNEKGCGEGNRAPALLPDARGAGVPAAVDPPRQAVEAHPRPQDGTGQGGQQPQRPEARASDGGGDGRGGGAEDGPEVPIPQ